MYKNVIFDFDGTLVDSENIICCSIQEYLKREHDYQLSKKSYQRFIGTEENEFYSFLKMEIGLPVKIEDLNRAIDNYQKEAYSTMSLRPGMEKFISSCSKKGSKLGIVSNSSWQELDYFFHSRPELQHLFSSIVTKDRVSKGKPDPEGYLKCLEELGGKAEETIAFEDSKVGVEAALAADIPTYIVPSEYTSDLTFPVNARSIKELNSFSEFY